MRQYHVGIDVSKGRHVAAVVDEHDQVLIKDLDRCLLDFPSEREGRMVFLCWEYGEPELAFWHDIDAGFTGRHPL